MGGVALWLWGLWLLALLWGDRKERASVSSATWLVCAWAVIQSSRPVTSWFGGDEAGRALPASYDEGNPGEALIYLVLMVAGLLVLIHRRLRVSSVITANSWLSAFYLFCLLSVLWSDYPLITFKRWIKDLGGVIMVLVILTEREPLQAVKAAFTRCAYVSIPMSVLLIRYFPDLGRAYAGYNRSELMYVGVTLHKNSLGTLALISALFLLWDLLDRWELPRGALATVGLAARASALVLCWYLLVLVNSATSLVCAVVGSGLLVAFRLPLMSAVRSRLELCGLTLGGALLLVDSAFDLKSQLVLALDRDTTLTTRTDIWPILLRHQESPLFGAGFNTFWAGRRLVLLQEYDAVGGIIQAHNGYLETFLNIGWIGITLLALVMLAAYLHIRGDLAAGVSGGQMRLVLLVVALVYNISEAAFNKLSLVWFATLFAIMVYEAPRGQRVAVRRAKRGAAASPPSALLGTGPHAERGQLPPALAGPGLTTRTICDARDRSKSTVSRRRAAPDSRG